MTNMAIEPIFVPYAGHTSTEMVGLMRSIYIKNNGDRYKFTKHILSSRDPRISTMNHFAIDVFYEFCKEVLRNENA